MEFEWDDDKNKRNIAKHSVDFRDALHVFIDENRVERLDLRFIYGEERWQTVGITPKGVLFVVYTEREGGNLVRLVTARKASKRERSAYQKGIFFSDSKEAWYGNESSEV